MNLLELNPQKSVQVITARNVCRDFKIEMAELKHLIVINKLRFNEDVFIVTCTKRSGRPYPEPMLLIVIKAFAPVIRAKRREMFPRYQKLIKKQKVQNREGRFGFEHHSTEEFNELLGVTDTQPAAAQTDPTKQEENYMI